MKVKEIKDRFLHVRIDPTEEMRIKKLVGLTRRKRSDLIRQAMYHYLQSQFPECLV